MLGRRTTEEFGGSLEYGWLSSPTERRTLGLAFHISPIVIAACRRRCWSLIKSSTKASIIAAGWIRRAIAV